MSTRFRILTFFVWLFIFQGMVNAASTGEKTVWVTHKNIYPLLEAQSRNGHDADQVAVAKDAKALGFAETPYTVLEEKEGDDGNGVSYVLLGVKSEDEKSADNKKIGWLEKDFVIGVDPFAGPTNIRKRAMVRPPELVLGQIAKDPELEPVAPLFAAPMDNSFPVKTVPWGSYHFVYKDSGDYALIGTSALIEDPGAILGWIKKENLIESQSRETFWWNHKNVSKRKPAKAFEFPADAYADATEAENRKPSLFLEIPNSHSPGQMKSRFPDLLYLGDKYPRTDVKTGNRLFKLGVLAQKGLSDDDRESRLKMIENIRNNNKLDLVFLIDETESMEDHFPAIRGIVGPMIDNLQQMDDWQIRFAISYFNDADLQTGTHDPQITRLTADKEEIENQRGELLTHETIRWIDPDPAEMLFDGIEKAVQGADYHPKANKILVVFTTDPDKSGMPEIEGSKQAAGRVVDLLEPKNVRPIELYAIQIEDESGDRYKLAMQIERQILGPFRLNHADKFPHKRGKTDSLGGYVNDRDSNVIRDYVLYGFNRRVQSNKDRINQIVSEIYGDWDAKFGEAMDKDLRERNIDPDKLPTNAVEYREVYVWENDQQGEKQIRPWVLMDVAELEKIQSFLAGLVQGLDPETPVRELVINQVKALTSTVPAEDQSVADLIKDRMRLPVSSPMLQRTLNELNEPLQDAAAEKNGLAKKLEAINAVLSDNEPYYTDASSGNKWFWVDAEDLP